MIIVLTFDIDIPRDTLTISLASSPEAADSGGQRTSRNKIATIQRVNPLIIWGFWQRSDLATGPFHNSFVIGARLVGTRL